jgi:AraC-like DNA-binding protein
MKELQMGARNRRTGQVLGRASSDAPIAYSALSGIVGTAQMPGIRCRVDAASYSGSASSNILRNSNLFACKLDGRFDEIAVAKFDGGQRKLLRHEDPSHCILVPRDTEFATERKGTVAGRYFLFEFDSAVLTLVFGQVLRNHEFRPHFGPSPMATGVVRRLAAVCSAPIDVPLTYVEALGNVILVDLYRAFGSRPLPPLPSTHIGATRFKTVLDYIDSALDEDISLHFLAQLVGLSSSHFSHAFKSKYGVAPYHYILQRRVMRAKSLLRLTDDTVAEIAVDVGFSSQSRFSVVFSRFTGFTPSAYRSSTR